MSVDLRSYETTDRGPNSFHTRQGIGCLSTSFPVPALDKATVFIPLRALDVCRLLVKSWMKRM